MAMFAKSSKSLVPEFIETGNIGLDMAVSNGRGIPIGGCVILYSAPGAGKSTIVADAMRRILAKHEAQDLPYRAIYIDIERSDTLMKKVGLLDYVDDEHGNRLLYKPGYTTFDDLEEMCKGILKGDEEYKDVKLIAIDSLGLLICEQEENKDLNTGDFGTATKTRNTFYKKYVSKLKDMGITFLFISQQRANQNAGLFGDPKKAALADGDHHIADVILKLSKSEGGSRAEIKKQEIKSSTSASTVKLSPNFITKISKIKNRYVNVPEVEVLCTYGRGVQNRFILNTMLTNYNLAKNKGTARSPKWVVDNELLAFVGEDTYKQESNTKEYLKWLRDCVTPIKDFLRQKDLYRSVPDEIDVDDEE